MSFIEELKRRKVFRVAATYAVVAWILMQIGEVTFPALNIPEWVMSTLVVLLLAGFPIAVIFAWIFDKTPQGFIKTDATETENIGGMNVKVDDRPLYLQKRNIFLALGVIAGVLIGTYGGETFKKSIYDNRQSIAVLPFDNMSEGENDDYFSDGITEDIITYLSKIRGLKVISRTSVMQYKDSKLNIRDIAKELGVENILEGSVRRAGDQVRITGQLIDAKTDEHLWADIYDRRISDIFKVQSEVAKTIASTLGAELTTDEAEELSDAKEINPMAYDYYLKRGRRGTSNKNEIEQSIRYLEKALDYEPEYIDAILALASDHGVMYFLGFDRTDSRLALYRKYIELGKKIGPKNPYVLEEEGFYHYRVFRDYDKAFELLEKANLKRSESFGLRAWALRRMGRWEECVENIIQSIELNPKGAALYRELAGTYLSMSQFDNAKEAIEKSLEMAPNDYETHLYKAGWYFLRSFGDIEKSYAAYKDAENQVGRGRFDWDLILVDIYAGDYEKAHQRLNGIPDEELVWQQQILSKNMVRGQLYYLEGKNNEASSYLLKAEKRYEEWIKESPGDRRGYVALSKVKAWMGKKTEAIQYARKAVSVLPIQKDYLAGPGQIKNLAYVYATVGEKELAVKELEYLSTVMNGFYKGEVSLNPAFADIRKDSRIKLLLEK